jgi:hypothetical protein
MVTLEISHLSKPHQFWELRHLVDLNRLYRKGTDLKNYLDLEEQSPASLELLVLKLEQIPGLKARVL